MKTFTAGAVFLLTLMLANVVAAGVFAVLGPLALELKDDAAGVIAVALIGLVSIGCALLFLKGALALAGERFYLVRSDPYKGLRFGSGRRGG